MRRYIQGPMHCITEETIDMTNMSQKERTNQAMHRYEETPQKCCRPCRCCVMGIRKSNHGTMRQRANEVKKIYAKETYVVGTASSGGSRRMDGVIR